MVERPLFDPDRRVAAVLGNAVEPPAEDLSHPLIDFIGTMTDDKGIRALIRGPQGIRGVLVGEEIDGWDILTIEARRLILYRRAEQIEFTILAPAS